MTIVTWLRTPRIRRGLAASVVVLAAGGLVLFRNPASAHPPRFPLADLQPPTPFSPTPSGSNTANFAGPGAHGTIALSHKSVLGGNAQPLYADVRLVADPVERSRAHAPLAIAVVLDTSGSMSGEKMDQAKDSVIRLVREMKDDDQIAMVRYSDDSEVVQELATVGSVRRDLVRKIEGLSAGGGTAIPRGLSRGLRALDEAAKGRVRRVVLVSDGLDSTRVEAERMAQESFGRGITISSMGIGLDFDESYMGGVARAGHGNFGFVKDASALATFLRREVDEAAATTVEDATVRLTLPDGVRFVRASGADSRVISPREVELKMGALFAGDERRALVELATTLDRGETRGIDARATWRRVGGGLAEAPSARLEIVATNDAHAVQESLDPGVLASWTSVAASERQLEAAEAYAHGDTHKADALIDKNIDDLRAAAVAAPAAMATSLSKQMLEYRGTKSSFARAMPTSEQGKTAAKHAAEKDSSNLSRIGF